jgi:phage gp29-like protein
MRASAAFRLGHAVGKEHWQVQKDIERTDARVLSAILNLDLIRPWILLGFSDHDGKLPG